MTIRLKTAEEKGEKKTRKPREPKVPTVTGDLINAIQWVLCAQNFAENRPDFERHSLIANNWIMASNGVITAGHKIETELVASPNTQLLHAALIHAGNKLAITQAANGELMVKSNQFNSTIPVAAQGSLQVSMPDPPQIQIGTTIKDGFDIVAPIAKESAQTVESATIKLQSGSMFATNRNVIIEFWHGWQIPVFIIPRKSVDAFRKSEHEMTAIGFSANSLTIWYGDTAWIKTQVINEEWPDMSKILDQFQYTFVPVPAGLKMAIEAVLPHSPDEMVHFDAGHVYSHERNEMLSGAVVPCNDVTRPGAVIGKNMLYVLEHATHWDPIPSNAIMFMGINLRGAIAYGERDEKETAAAP